MRMSALVDNALSAQYLEREYAAKFGRSAQTKTAPEEAAIDYLLYSYAYFITKQGFFVCALATLRPCTLYPE